MNFRILVLLFSSMVLARSSMSAADFASDQVYDGKGATYSRRADLSGLKNVVLRNYHFESGVVLHANSQVSVEACEFTGAGLRIGESVVDCTIKDCSFHDLKDYTGIVADNTSPVGLTIQGCKFDHVTEGIHLLWILGDGVPCRTKVVYNQFRHISHFALECQGDANGLEVAYNWADDWVPQVSQIGFSIATGGTTQRNDLCWGVKVHDNVIGGKTLRSDPGGPDVYYTAIEAMGQDIQVYRNFVSGPWGLACLYGWTSPKWGFYENTLVGLRPFRGLNPAISGEKNGVKPDEANVRDDRQLPDGAVATPPPVPGQAGAVNAAEPKAARRDPRN